MVFSFPLERSIREPAMESNSLDQRKKRRVFSKLADDKLILFILQNDGVMILFVWPAPLSCVAARRHH